MTSMLLNKAWPIFSGQRIPPPFPCYISSKATAHRTTNGKGHNGHNRYCDKECLMVTESSFKLITGLSSMACPIKVQQLEVVFDWMCKCISAWIWWSEWISELYTGLLLTECYGISLLLPHTGKPTHYLFPWRIGTCEVQAQLLQLPPVGHVCNTVVNSNSLFRLAFFGAAEILAFRIPRCRISGAGDVSWCPDLHVTVWRPTWPTRPTPPTARCPPSRSRRWARRLIWVRVFAKLRRWLWTV